MQIKLSEKSIQRLSNIINEESEYRSGSKLVSFFNELGFKDVYGKGFPSRRIYTEEKLKQINGTPNLIQCIQKTFSPVNFIGNFDLLKSLVSSFNEYLNFDGYKVVVKGKTVFLEEEKEEVVLDTTTTSEKDFLQKEFDTTSLDQLIGTDIIKDILNERFLEIQKCFHIEAHLAVVFLCGSTLEGIFLSVAQKNPKKFNSCKATPLGKNKKPKTFSNWTLANFIDVSKELQLIGEDIKKFSHALRAFRNYIHPYQQLSENFSPTKHTAEICWKVLQAVVFYLSK